MLPNELANCVHQAVPRAENERDRKLFESFAEFISKKLSGSDKVAEKKLDVSIEDLPSILEQFFHSYPLFSNEVRGLVNPLTSEVNLGPIEPVIKFLSKIYESDVSILMLRWLGQGREAVLKYKVRRFLDLKLTEVESALQNSCAIVFAGAYISVETIDKMLSVLIRWRSWEVKFKTNPKNFRDVSEVVFDENFYCETSEMFERLITSGIEQKFNILSERLSKYE